MTKNAYEDAYEKYHGSVKSLMWNSYSSAAKRYTEIVQDLDFKNKSILDIGCGFGDLIPFIFSKSSNFSYTGIDLTEKFILEANKRYPEYTFLTGDYFKKPLNDKFDIVLCCGALNGNCGSETLAIRKKSIKTMFDHAKEAVIFNMAGGINPSNEKNSIIYYANSLEILKYCATLSKNIILRNHYHKKDFTIVIVK